MFELQKTECTSSKEIKIGGKAIFFQITRTLSPTLALQNIISSIQKIEI